MALLDIKDGFWGLRRQMEALVGRRLADSALQQAGANGGASFARAFIGQADDAQALRDCIAAYQAAGFGHFEVEVLEWPIGRVLVRASEAIESWAIQQHGRSSESPICAYTAGVLIGFVNVLADRRDIVCVEQTCQAQGAEYCRFELLPAAVVGGVPVVAIDPDPALGRQLNLLETLFERMPMGIAVFDQSYHIRRYNPTWQDFSRRYAPPSGAPLVPGVYYFDHLPGSEPIVIPLFERVLAGETIRQHGLRFESRGIVSYWDVVLSPLAENGQVNGILNVTIDATERVMAQQNLEQRVEERTHELRTLLQVSQDINSTLELEPLLDLLLDQLKTVVDYTGASILILESGDLAIQAYRGPISGEQAQRLRFSLEKARLNREVIQRREPLMVPDVRGDTPLAHMFQQAAGGELESTFGYIRSWLGVPLMVKDEMLGMLTLDHKQPGYFTAQHADLALTFANQAAIAIEHGRLYRVEQERLEESESRRGIAESLRDIVAAINASLPLRDILDRIVQQAATHLGASACILSRLDLAKEESVHEATYGWPAELMSWNVIPFAQQRQTGSEDYRLAMLRREPTYGNYGPLPDRLDEIRNDPSISPEIKARRLIIRTHFAGSMGVPLIVNDQMYGGLAFYYAEPQAFSEEQIQLALTFADQAALAMENAQLRQQAAQSAIIAERNRLARDLHDAVTQTLFSASLIAEVLPRIWERNPPEGERRLAELRELTRGALAEMRTLLLELRPSALAEAQLGDLMRQLGESITGRARVPVSVQVEGECQAPVEVKVALYRIAQEALNNVAKHADASEAAVHLHCTSDRVDLSVCDNGRGFDPAHFPPDHLGLGIMRERAETVGATLLIDSQAGHGTQIQVSWKKDPYKPEKDER